MEKRGSHVGFVLSFVIFMTFIFFIYLITSPALKTERKDTYLEYLIGSLKEKSSANLTAVSVAITQPNPQNCVRFSNFFSTTRMGNNFIVKNSAENVLQSQIDATDLLVVLGTGDKFLKVYESSEFGAAASGSINPCQQLNQGNGYSLGLMRTSENIFETKIISLIGNYSSNYSGLRSQLKISLVNEFNFSFTYNNGTQIPIQNQNQTISRNINIYAKNVPIVYTSGKAAAESGFLNVKIW